MRIIDSGIAFENIDTTIDFDKEFFPLLNRLVKNDIPFDVRRLWDGFQIIYPNIDTWTCSVIIHSGSYGVKEGLLEIKGLSENDESNVEGFLHEYDVFNRIFKHYIENRDS